MRFIVLLIAFLTLPVFSQEDEQEVDPDQFANMVRLDDMKARNLGIEIADVVETDFETTVFAIGRIEEIPSRHSVLSSRIPGRIASLEAIEGDRVEAGQLLVKVESRQPGNPPPVIPLYAPISGIVSESHVRMGEPVEPSNELLDIIDLSEVWAVARVPEQEAASIRVGSQSRIRIAAIPDKTFTGELIRFGTTADPKAGTLDAIFRIANPDYALRPGMRAEFSIVASSRPNVTAVPLEALQGDPASRVVYIKDFDLPNVFLKSPVQTGARNDRYVEIISGLFPGDQVVTKGSYFLGFVGGGGGSLKDALDAAHGHPHNEDGTPMSAEEISRSEESGDGHEEHAAPNSHLILPLAIFSIFAVALLIISGIKIAGAQARIRKLESENGQLITTNQ